MVPQYKPESVLMLGFSGGKVMVNHKTWYAHLFRTAGGDFGFPYEQSGRAVEKTKKYIKDKFWNKKHSKQIHPVSWLIKKFMPISVKNKEGVEIGWTEEKLLEISNK